MGVFKKAIKKHRTAFKEKLNKKLKIEPIKKFQDFNHKALERHKDLAKDIKKGVQDFNHKALERHKELAQNIKQGVNHLNDKRQEFNHKALEKHQAFGKNLGSAFVRKRNPDLGSVDSQNEISEQDSFNANEFEQPQEPTIYYDKNGNEIFRA